MPRELRLINRSIGHAGAAGRKNMGLADNVFVAVQMDGTEYRVGNRARSVCCPPQARASKSTLARTSVLVRVRKLERGLEVALPGLTWTASSSRA